MDNSRKMRILEKLAGFASSMPSFGGPGKLLKSKGIPSTTAGSAGANRLGSNLAPKTKFVTNRQGKQVPAPPPQ